MLHLHLLEVVQDSQASASFCKVSKNVIQHLYEETINMTPPAIPVAVASPASSSSDHTSDNLAPQSRRSRVSAEHTLNRVRENQRRHRARQRDHVASLEEKLAETEKLLQEAIAEIAALKEEAAAATRQLNGGHRDSTYEENCNSRRSESQENIHASSQQENELALVQPHANLDPRLDYPDVPIPDLSFLGDPSFYLTPTTDLSNTSSTIPSPSHLPDLLGPPPCCSDPPSSLSPDLPVDPQCSSCSTKPLPDPSESTTLCAQAYVMISQQNFKDVDPDTIRLWLAQGLRRAKKEGEGCRVENGALLRLLDFISGL